MARVNENYLKLPGSYLFSKIGKKVAAYSAANPDKKIIRLGIGDVTQPIAPSIIEATHKAVEEMGHAETFHGYAPDLGYEFLRSAIAKEYKDRGCHVDIDEVFVSDGAKCDCGNIQEIFAADSVIAVCDPVYPVYVDSNVMAGRTGVYDPKTETWSNVIYMPCTQENNFTPALPEKTPDLIYLCYPNNPTGSVITKDELQKWLIMQMRRVQLSSTTQPMKLTFQRKIFHIPSMSVKVQEHVQLSLEAFLRMPDLQECVLALL